MFRTKEVIVSGADMYLAEFQNMHSFFDSHYGAVFLKLAEIAGSGGFGGIVYALKVLQEGGRTEDYKKREQKVREDELHVKPVVTWKATNGVPFWKYVAGQLVIGSGGAFAAVFAILTVGNAVRAGGTNDFTPPTIYLITLCAVGGFASNRLLAVVGDDLIKRLSADTKKLKDGLAEVDGKVKSVEDQTIKAAETADQAMEFAAQSSKLLVDLSKASGIVDQIEGPLAEGKGITDKLKLDATDLRQKLLEHIRKVPLNRTLVIVLANLDFNLGLVTENPELVDEADNLLSKFLEDKKKQGTPEGDDEATVLYNIACYNSILSGRPDYSEKHAALLERGIVALRRSLEIVKSTEPQQISYWIESCNSDSDLLLVVGTPQYKELIAEYQPLPA